MDHLHQLELAARTQLFTAHTLTADTAVLSVTQCDHRRLHTLYITYCSVALQSFTSLERATRRSLEHSSFLVAIF